MVRSVWRLIQKEFKGLHQAAFLLGAATLGSQILALVRDRLLAGTFGASAELDVYYAAFRLPDLLYVSLASMISVTVLIPFIVNRLEKSKAEVSELLNQLYTLFCLAMAVIGLLLFLALPYLASYLAPGFEGQDLDSFVTLSRILLLSPFLLGLSNLLGSLTQTFQRFFVYALSPVLYNVGIIIGILWFYPIWGLSGLAWGVAVGALAHMLIQVPAVWRLGFALKLTKNLSWSEIKPVILTSLPRTGALAAHQLIILVLVALGSLLVVGSISVFTLSFNLQGVPLAIIGVSYSVAAFPALAKLQAKGYLTKFKEQLTVAVRHIVFWSAPATVMLIVLRAQLVRVILGTGRFDWQETQLTAASLAIFALSVTAQSLLLLFIRAYYAGGRTFIPVVTNGVSAVMIIAGAWGLLWAFEEFLVWRLFVENLFRVQGVAGTEVLMLPLAFSVGTWLNLLILWCLFRRTFGGLDPLIWRTFGQVSAASIFGGLVAYQTLVVLAPVFDLNTFFGILSQGLLAGVAGVSFWFFMLWLLGNTELWEVVTSLKGKFWKSRLIIPEPEEL